MNSNLIEYLSEYLNKNKKEKIDKVIVDRTRYITLVLEDVFQTHNASAAVRSAECFGIQDIHVIENRNKFSPMNSVARGSAKWIDIYHHRKTKSCMEFLRKNGYKIVAAVPEKKSVNLCQLEISQKVALVFGAEAVGLSDEAMNLADEFVSIPMFGFTESFNISVSVAICLYDLIGRLHSSNINWRLSPEEVLEIKLNWLKKSISGSDELEKRFLQKN